MDINIKIPEEFINDFLGNNLPGIDQGGFSDFFGRVEADLRGNMLLCGNYELETLKMLRKAFMDAKLSMESEQIKDEQENSDIDTHCLRRRGGR